MNNGGWKCVCYLWLGLLLFWLFGCATGLTDKDVDRQIQLWQGAVNTVKQLGAEATVTLTLETAEGEVYAKQSFGMTPPVRVRLNVATTVEP